MCNVYINSSYSYRCRSSWNESRGLLTSVSPYLSLTYSLQLPWTLLLSGVFVVNWKHLCDEVQLLLELFFCRPGCVVLAVITHC